MQEYVRENFVKRQSFQRNARIVNASDLGTSLSAQPLLPIGDTSLGKSILFLIFHIIYFQVFYNYYYFMFYNYTYVSIWFFLRPVVQTSVQLSFWCFRYHLFLISCGYLFSLVLHLGCFSVVDLDTTYIFSIYLSRSLPIQKLYFLPNYQIYFFKGMFSFVLPILNTHISFFKFLKFFNKFF